MAAGKPKMTLVEMKLALANQGLPVTVHTPGFKTAKGVLKLLPDDDGILKCTHFVPFGPFTRDVDTIIHARDLNQPTLKLGWRLQRYVDENSGLGVDDSNAGRVRYRGDQTDSISAPEGSMAARSLSLTASNAVLDLTFDDYIQRDQVFDILTTLWEDARPEGPPEPNRRISLALQGKNLTKQIAREEAVEQGEETFDQADESQVNTHGRVGRLREIASTKAWSKEAMSEPEVASAIKQLSEGTLVTEWVDSMMGLVTVTEQRLLRFDLDAESIIVEPVLADGKSDGFRLFGANDDVAVVFPISDLKTVGVQGRTSSALTTRLLERTEGKPQLRAKSMSLVFSSRAVNLTLSSEREVARLARFFNMARDGRLVKPAGAPEFAAAVGNHGSNNDEEENNEGDGDEAGGEDWAATLAAAGTAGGRSKRPGQGSQPSKQQQRGAGNFQLPLPPNAKNAAASGADLDEEGSDDEIDPSCSWAAVPPRTDPEASLEARLARAAALKGPPTAARAAVTSAVDPNPRRRSQPALAEGGGAQAAAK